MTARRSSPQRAAQPKVNGFLEGYAGIHPQIATAFSGPGPLNSTPKPVVTPMAGFEPVCRIPAHPAATLRSWRPSGVCWWLLYERALPAGCHAGTSLVAPAPRRNMTRLLVAVAVRGARELGLHSLPRKTNPSAELSASAQLLLEWDCTDVLPLENGNTLHLSRDKCSARCHRLCQSLTDYCPPTRGAF